MEAALVAASLSSNLAFVPERRVTRARPQREGCLTVDAFKGTLAHEAPSPLERDLRNKRVAPRVSAVHHTARAMDLLALETLENAAKTAKGASFRPTSPFATASATRERIRFPRSTPRAR